MSGRESGPAGPGEPAPGPAGPDGPAEPWLAGGPSPVPPGTGWPEDPATAATPVAATPAEAAALAASAGSLAELAARESVCRACPRLVAWREEVAASRRRAYAAERYWGRPIPGWGDEHPRVLILGLAPAAHGGNRTGRVFTGDRSGDVLFASLWRAGLASQPTSVRAGDGQRLLGARTAAAVRCAPPANKPTPAERDACAPWLAAELAVAAADLRVVVCLGGFAWQALWPLLAAAGWTVPRPRPAFGHGAQVTVRRDGAQAAASRDGAQAAASRDGAQAAASRDGAGLLVLGCYHPSQQNTFTGRVTPAMLDDVLGYARQAAGLPEPS